MQHCTPLGYLFLKAHDPGSTSCSESGVKLTLTRRAGETNLIFRMDEERRRDDQTGAPDENFGTHFEIQDEPRADVMLLYLKRGEGDDNLIRLVVLELKGKDHAHAVCQLDRTLVALEIFTDRK